MLQLSCESVNALILRRLLHGNNQLFYLLSNIIVLELPHVPIETPESAGNRISRIASREHGEEIHTEESDRNKGDDLPNKRSVSLLVSICFTIIDKLLYALLSEAMELLAGYQTLILRPSSSLVLELLGKSLGILGWRIYTLITRKIQRTSGVTYEHCAIAIFPRWNLGYHEAWLDSLGLEECQALLEHSILHARVAFFGF